MTVNFGYVERIDTPLILGISGPSKSGKTGSAIELAHGMQEVQGGDIGMLDSEAGRGNHYQGAPFFSDTNKRFKYKYAEFGAPFAPANYQANVEAAVKQGIKHLIVDSMSLLHEGTGGILDWHSKEVERMTRKACERFNKKYDGPDEKHNLPAWAAPKTALTHFRDYFTQQKINLIFCFRAKEKLKLIPGEKPKALGFQPIISDELIFEMTTSFLLYPGANGVPNYEATELDEKKVISIPAQFAPIFSDRKRSLSAWHGKQMARWAQGKKGEAAPASAPAPAAAKPQQTPPPPPADDGGL